MKPFKQRVKEHLMSENWNVQYTNIPYIDFFTVRRGAHMKKAYRIKQHGHLTRKEQTELYEFGKNTGMHVLYVHEVADRGLEFIRVYPQNQKTEAI